MDGIMQLALHSNDNELTYEWFKTVIESWLKKMNDESLYITLKDDYHHDKIQGLFNEVAKLTGLIIADGPLSRIMKHQRLSSITFRGLNLNTLYSIFHTATKLSQVIKINISRQNTKRMNKPYYDITLYLRKDLHNEVLCFIHDMLMKPTKLSTLPMDMISALFAGLIDGDGYIGKIKKHVVITYNKNSLKGRFVDYFLSHLESLGLISLGKYRGEPHYERYVRFVNINFARNTCSYVYHPEKHKRFEELIKGLTKTYVCRYMVDEIVEWIKRASSAYIDFRRNERGRKAPILVIYVHKENSIRDRLVIKVTSKCFKELEKSVNILMNNIEFEKVNRNVINVVFHYLNLLKAYKIG